MLAPVYTSQNPRWTAEMRAAWVNAAMTRRRGVLVEPTTVEAEVATAELVLDRLARDGAVIIARLVLPSVCAEVLAQKDCTYSG